MKKVKFDKCELDIIASLLDRKIHKINEKEIDEFNLEYREVLQNLLNKVKSINKEWKFNQ